MLYYTVNAFKYNYVVDEQSLKFKFDFKLVIHNDFSRCPSFILLKTELILKQVISDRSSENLLPPQFVYTNWCTAFQIL